MEVAAEDVEDEGDVLVLEDKLKLEVERVEEEDDEKNSVLADNSIEEDEEGQCEGMGLGLELVLDNVVSAEK